MTKFGAGLVKSLTEALAHARGKESGVQGRIVEVADVRAIRRQLGMPQQLFAETYRVRCDLEKLGAAAAPS